MNWRNPGYDYSNKHPVTVITYNDSQKFINWINKKFQQRYRLPTEAEWEYACRSGSNTHFYGGNLSENAVKNNTKEPNNALDKVAWYYSNSSSPHPVGLKQPNAWGLYDMHGNVWEFCQDSFIAVFPLKHVIDPVFKSDNKRELIIRGGDWKSYQAFVTSSTRACIYVDDCDDDMGFRLVKDAMYDDLKEQYKTK